MDIHVRRQNLKKFKQLLKSKTISFRVKTRNLQRLINGERTRFRSAVSFDAAFHSYYQVKSTKTRNYSAEHKKEAMPNSFNLRMCHPHTPAKDKNHLVRQNEQNNKKTLLGGFS